MTSLYHFQVIFYKKKFFYIKVCFFLILLKFFFFITNFYFIDHIQLTVKDYREKLYDIITMKKTNIRRIHHDRLQTRSNSCNPNQNQIYQQQQKQQSQQQLQNNFHKRRQYSNQTRAISNENVLRNHDNQANQYYNNNHRSERLQKSNNTQSNNNNLKYNDNEIHSGYNTSLPNGNFIPLSTSSSSLPQNNITNKISSRNSSTNSVNQHHILHYHEVCKIKLFYFILHN